MKSKKQIGANIRGLREYYGETQEELAFSLHLAGKSTIQHYEKGRREPDRDTLAAIAAHYQISVEELLTCDFSSLKRAKVDELTFFKHIDIIFPIVSSEKALQSDDFREAFEAHRSFYKQCHAFSFNATADLENAFNEAVSICPVGYMEAIERDENNIEACANYLSFLYLVMLMMKSLPTIMRTQPAAIIKAAAKNERLKKSLDDLSPTFDSSAKAIMNDLEDETMREYHSDLLIAVKQSTEWSDLADYYLCLQFLWNLVDNDLEWGFNQRIGVEMLNAFASINNPYAIRFIKLGLDSITASGPQNVVDRN